MRCIGRGIQYRVLSDGNGRVHKVPHSLPVMAYLMRIRRRGLRYLNSLARAWQLRRHNRQSIARLRAIDLSACCRLLGNPTFIGSGLRYEQDLATPLDVAVQGMDSNQRRALAEALSDTIVVLWSYGLADVTYNVTLQYGLTADGHVILLDLGELTYDIEKVRHDIAERKWLNSWSFTWLTEKNLHREFKAVMAERLTIPVLDSQWCRNRDGSPCSNHSDGK